MSEEVGSVIVAKGRHYVGGFIACPDADLSRPELSLCVVGSSDRGRLLATALALGIGRIGWAPGVRHLATSSLRIDGPPDEPVQADGDVIGGLPAMFSVAPETLRMIAK